MLGERPAWIEMEEGDGGMPLLVKGNLPMASLAGVVLLKQLFQLGDEVEGDRIFGESFSRRSSLSFGNLVHGVS